MDVLKSLNEIVSFLYAERLMEAEALERHLLSALKTSSKPENKVVVALLHEPQESAHAKIEVINRALRYLESAYQIRAARIPRTDAFKRRTA